MAALLPQGRLDNATLLRTPGVRKALPRYAKVVLDGLPARFQLARRIVFEPRRSMSANMMWAEHAKLMQKLGQMRGMVDKGKLDVRELDVPRFSLLDLKAMLAEEVMRACELCERRCGVDRTKAERGFCNAGKEWRITNSGVRTDVEQELAPAFTISSAGRTDAQAGTAWPEGHVAKWAQAMEKAGCRSLHVTGGEPACYVANVLRMLAACKANLPAVFGSDACMSEKAMELLDGAVDVFLLDFRYFDNDCARMLSDAPRYAEAAKRTHLLAKMQAELIVRVPLMPEHIECDAKPALKWIKSNLGPWTRVNVITKYERRDRGYMGMDRKLTADEIADAIAYAKKAGLKNVLHD
jgi:putative pyruvate formate lyase activating enzyme